MTILVFGKSGQLARSLADASADRSVPITFVGRDEADFRVPGAAAAVVRSVRPHLLINAAAFTDVDRAETERELAFRINADAPGEIASAAAAVGAGVIQVSTDYVFDGTATEPYREDSSLAPINRYGQSKLKGDEAICRFNPDHLIIRTSWIVSPFARNFVKTMLRLAEDCDEIRVVADQVGRPTPAADLAGAIIDLVERWPMVGRGVYHIAGGGEPTSWAGLAEHVMAARRRLLGSAATIRSIAATDYPTAARRPPNSVLDLSKAEQELGITLPDWRRGVDEVVGHLLSPAAK